MTVKFDDDSVADYFDRQVDEGRTPEQFGRIWIHTHPGHSPDPSCTDDETFERCFGSSDWAVMLIVARGGQAYARLRFNAGPVGQFVLPVEIDFQAPFAAANQAAWEDEYGRCVSLEPERPRPRPIARPFDVVFPRSPDDGLDLGERRFERFSTDLPLEPIDAPF